MSAAMQESERHRRRRSGQGPLSLLTVFAVHLVSLPAAQEACRSGLLPVLPSLRLSSRYGTGTASEPWVVNYVV